MKKKPKLRLVPRNKVSKIYKLIILELSTEVVLSYDLELWDYYEDDKEWIVFAKKDDTAMHAYFVYNVISVKFEKKVLEQVANIDTKPDLKPVA